MSYGPENHEFLFADSMDNANTVADGGETASRVKPVLALRRYIDSLPKTAGKFTITEVCRASEFDLTQQIFNEDMLWLVGSWPLSDLYTQSGGRRAWVNPQYTDRELYSDVVAECECGAVVTEVRKMDNVSKFEDPNEHGAGCKIEDRTRAVARLLENRRRVMEQLPLYGIALTGFDDRLHYGGSSIGHLAQVMDISVQERKTRGYQKRRATMIRLLRMGHHPKEVGEVYGLSASRVREIIAYQTEHDLSELRP